jgi:predicted transcriptional regulator
MTKGKTMKRTLTIKLHQDWRAALEEAREGALSAIESGRNEGATLAFTSPAEFFADITANRWALVEELQGAGTVGVRELSRRLGRDVKNVHADAAVLIGLNLIEKNSKGALRCPYDEIHLDMTLRHHAQRPHPIHPPVAANLRATA